MADRNLATIGSRSTAQSRITNNRDAVLPTRRLDQAPDLRNTLQMRDAYRSDSAVDEVRRTLGLVNNAVDRYGDYQNDKFLQAERQNASQAAADAAMGKVDEAKVSTSDAYRTAIAMSRARRKVAEVEMTLKPEIEDLLSKGADADPTKGEQPVDLEDVNSLIEQRFRSFLLDKDGRPIDFGDQAATMEVYNSLERLRPQLLTAAQDTIRAQEADKVVRGFADELSLQITKTGRADVESFMARLPPGVDRNKARASLLESAINAAEENENPEMLLKLADSRRADGTPTWTPQQESALRSAARTVQNLADQREEERSKETLGSLSVELRGGKRLSPDRVRDLISQGKLRPQDAELAFAIQERLDDDAWESKQRARADIQWGWSVADHNRAVRERAQSGEGNAAAMLLRADIAGGNLSPGEAHRRAATLFSQGQINLKTFEHLATEASQIPNNAKVVSTSGAAIWEQQLIRNFSTAAASAGKPGKASATDFNMRYGAAKETFYRSLRQGAEPEEAYARALANMPGADRNFIRNEVLRGRAANSRSTAKDQR